jgi:hypothetical protein
LERSRPDTQRLSVEFIQAFIDSLSPDKKPKLPTIYWDVIGEFSNELPRYLSEFAESKDVNFCRAASRLSHFNPSAVQKCLSTFSDPLLTKFINAISPKSTISLLEILPPHAKNCADPANPNFDSSFLFLGKLFRSSKLFVTEETDLVKPLVDGAIVAVSKEGISNVRRHALLTFLRAAALRGWVEPKRIFKQTLPRSDIPPMRKVSFQIIFTGIEDAVASSGIRADLLRAVKLYTTSVFKLLSKHLIPTIAAIHGAQPEFAVSLIVTMLRVLPTAPRDIGLLLQLLNAAPIQIYENFDTNLLFTKFSGISDTCVTEPLSIFVARAGVSVNYGALDLIGDSAAASYRYLSSIDRPLLGEILESGVLPPAALSSVLQFFQRDSRLSTLYFWDVISLFEFEVRAFGLDVSAAFQEVCLGAADAGEHRWVSRESLDSLFAKISGDFYCSDFGLLMAATLGVIQTSYVCDNAHRDHLLKLAILCSFVANIFAAPTTIILNLVHTDFARLGRPESMEAAISSSSTRYWKQDLPVSHAPDIVRFAITSMGAEATTRLQYNYVLAAISTDRKLALDLAPRLKVPPPVPTFLSFAKARLFSELVAVCEALFPPEDWVLAKGDAEVIAGLPASDALAPNREKALARLSAEPPDPEPRWQPTSTAFELAAVEVGEIDVAVRESEGRTLAHLKAFLWHTGGPLPSGQTVAAVEEVVFQRASDMRLLTGFFYWANQMGATLDVTKWARQIEIVRFDDDTVHAIAALLLHARVPFRECQRVFRRLVQIAVEALGSPNFSRADLTNLLKKNRGVGWLLVRNLIRMDTANWATNPVVVAAAKGTIAGAYFAVPGRHQREYAREMLGFLSQLVLDPGPTELLDVPTCYDLPPQVGFVSYEAYFPVKKRLPSDFLYSILTALEGLKVTPWEFGPLFDCLELDDAQVPRIRKLLHLEKGLVRFLAPALFDPDRNDNWVDFFSFRPPSFTRAFVRALSSPVMPPVDPAFVEKVTPVLTPVFPALAFQGVKPGARPLRISLLKIGKLAPNLGEALLSKILLPSRESIGIFQAMMRLEPPQWKALFGRPFSPIERDAVVRTFLNSGASAGSNIYHGLRVIECVLALLKPDVVIPLIGSKDFLNQPNFPVVFVMFKRFEGFLRKRGLKEFLTFCDVFHHRPRGEVFDDEFRLEAFKDLSAVDAISAVLHQFEAPK